MKKQSGSVFLMIAIPLLLSMTIAFAGVFAYLMWGEGYYTQAESLAAALFPPRTLGQTDPDKSGEELYNMVINASVSHSKAGSYNDVTINTGDVTLKNKTVLGNLIISEAAGGGAVTLCDIVVRGEIIVQCGAKLTLDGVTAVTMRTEGAEMAELVLTGASTIYRLEANGPASIDESGLSAGYYGIKQVSAQSSEALKNVLLRCGTIEQTIKKD